MRQNMNTPTGRGNPPLSARFRKGQSGNPRGRPKQRAESPPYESVLGQLVTIDEGDGKKRQLTVEEAFILQMVRRGMQGDMIANQHCLRAIEEVAKFGQIGGTDNILYIEINSWLGSVNDVVLPLNMATKKGSDGPSPRVLIEPWLVESALARLGTRELTAEEQREVWDATRTPSKVQWPPWWTERRGTGRPRKRRGKVEEEVFYPPCVTYQGVDRK